MTTCLHYNNEKVSNVMTDKSQSLSWENYSVSKNMFSTQYNFIYNLRHHCDQIWKQINLFIFISSLFYIEYKYRKVSYSDLYYILNIWLFKKFQSN